MSEEPTERMPPPPTPLHATTKVPRVFGIWGTACYGVAAISSIITVLIMDFSRWVPPWWYITATSLYVFASAGIICFGRIQANRDAHGFIVLIRHRSEQNKRHLN